MKLWVGGIYGTTPMVIAQSLERAMEFISQIVIPRYGQHADADELVWAANLVDGWFVRLESMSKNGDRLYIEQLTLDDAEPAGDIREAHVTEILVPA